VVDWRELISSEDSPYEFSLETETGAVLKAEAPYPTLTIKSATEPEPATILMQVFEAEATRDGALPQKFAIGRLVALTEKGVELELHREVIPVSEDEGGEIVDMTTCPACRRRIVGTLHTVHEGRAYHTWCIK
jgi:hypothetical protein